MKESSKIFFSCAIGAFIGALIAMQLGYFWLIGVLSGGLVSYLGFNLKEVGVAIKDTYYKITDWQPDWKRMGKMIFLIILYSLVISTSFGSCCFLIALKHVIGEDLTYIITVISILVMYFMYMTTVINLTKTGDVDHRVMIKKLFKLNLPVVIFYQLPRGIIAIIKLLPIIRVFIKTVFISIHSDIRLMCGVDAALGATIGWFFFNPIIGALAGGLLGVINYEIISKRILKLAPAKS